MQYLIGNWKSYTTISEAHLWLSEFTKLAHRRYSNNVSSIICAPFTSLAEANRLIGESQLPLLIGAQNVSEYPEGKHTGEITAHMLSELTHYCLVGHSERRREFQETSLTVATKTKRLLDESLVPIICVDQPYLEEQIKALLDLQLPLQTCLFAYEPSSAIGTGQAISPVVAESIAAKIAFFTDDRCPILYGGSVTPENALSYLNQQHLSGVLVGTDSLTVSTFIKLQNLFV